MGGFASVSHADMVFSCTERPRITDLLNGFDTTRVLMFISFTQLDWN